RPRPRGGDSREHGERADGAGVVPERLRQPLVGLGRLVGVGAAEDYPPLADPALHLLARHRARMVRIRDPTALDLLATALCRGAAHRAAGAVNRRKESGRLVLGRGQRVAGRVDALEDDGVVAHAAADEAALSRERRRGALANNPDLVTVVDLEPGEVVVVVDLVQDLSAQD